jgi:hydrogenase maturation protease
MSGASVVGLGQPEAGDDGAGWAVLGALAGRVPSGVELVRAADASALIERLCRPGRVVIVDAVLGQPAGRVLVLSPEQLAAAPPAVSTHGLSAADAIALGRALAPDGATVALVGITIDRPSGAARGLSPPVANAIEPAAVAVLALLDERAAQGG